MEQDSLQTERRKYQRYPLPELVIAIPDKNEPQVARVVNVSRGGMAVRYVDQKDWLGDATKLDILVNSSFFMHDIPISCIRDFRVKNQVSLSVIRERQCCLQFMDLSPSQESLLDEFIRKFTAGNS